MSRDPWSRMRATRVDDAEQGVGFNSHKDGLLDSVPLRRIWAAWLRSSFVGWAKVQLPREDEVEHSPYYLSLTVSPPTLSRKRRREGRRVVPVTVAGRRVSVPAFVIFLFLLALTVNLLTRMM